MPKAASATVISAAGALRVSYFDQGTAAFPSRSGYGGLGFSGGLGEETVRIVNPTAANGPLCAMIYVFDDFEEMQACCGCPVTPDGLRTLSLADDLTFNFASRDANINAGLIEIVSSMLNFTPGNPPPAPNPPGTNGLSTGTVPDACSPSGIASNDPFGRAAAVSPVSGLRASITGDEFIEPGNIPAGRPVASVSVSDFEDAPLDAAHLANLQGRCGFMIENGSGGGFCTCGTGEDSAFIASNPLHSGS